LERNLPFFVEKPLAVEYAVGEAIAKRVAEKSLVTAVGYHLRYMDIVERAQDILRDNPARLALGYWIDGTPGVAWWQKNATSGGQMVEQTTHIFDLARYLVGDVATVYAVGSHIDRPAYPDLDVSDVTTAALTFTSGAIGSLSSTCLLKRGHRVGLHLYGDGLILEINSGDLLIDMGAGQIIEKAQVDPVLREDADFLAAVRGQENRIRSPYAESLKTHRVTTLAAQSVREGKVFNV
jgi:predicted dehydrogenase